MTKHFDVKQQREWLIIKKVSNVSLVNFHVYLDYQLVATFYTGDTFYVQCKDFTPKSLMIVAHQLDRGVPTSIGEQYYFPQTREEVRERDFKPGDILVASDNLNESMTGYVGHSALVVDKNNVIESPGGHPAIVKDTIQQFLDKHPAHAHFRPKSAELGKAATKYATNYLEKYKKNLEENKKKPVFSYNLSQSLEDPWEYIYCSKLIWLSYYKGADYKLENDYLWYSPEDLYTNLLENNDFELVYEHQDVEFKLNT